MCHEISPTNSEDMKYCATEADQFYKSFSPSYTHQTPSQLPHGGGGDSATDSAIDMPGDGSVSSTINEIPPHHSTAIMSSYYKHTPTVADYSDLLPEDSPADLRSRILYRAPKYMKPPIHGMPVVQSHPLKSPTNGHHPVIYEYNKPPINRSLVDRSDCDGASVPRQTFQHPNCDVATPQPTPQPSLPPRTRQDCHRRADESIVTV